MIIEPNTFAHLPFAAALFDLDGRFAAGTPEWAGPAPGAAGYATGQGHLVVAAEGVAPELDQLLGRLLAELAAGASLMSSEQAGRVELLRSGLELVSGRPPAARSVPAEAVVRLLECGLPARVPGLRLEVVVPAEWPRVTSPGAIALALLQLAVNAHSHEAADLVRLRMGPGPTFHIEWPLAKPRGSGIETHRHQARRLRWGWGYVQMVADHLGGVALPPGPTMAGWEGAALGLGSPRLALPLAVVRDQRVQVTTAAWEQGRGHPAAGHALSGELGELVAAAGAATGRIAYRDLYRARAAGSKVWLALAPETGSSRARDVLKGLEHERVLWTAAEPHATRVHALSVLLGVALGDPWPAVPPSIWRSDFGAACAALSLAPPPVPEAVMLPDPRLAAFLLGELGGELEARGGALALRPRVAAGTWSAAFFLTRDEAGLIRLTG